MPVFESSLHEKQQARRREECLSILEASESSQDIEARHIVELAKLLYADDFTSRDNMLKSIADGRARNHPEAALTLWQIAADCSIHYALMKAKAAIACVRSWDD